MSSGFGEGETSLAVDEPLFLYTDGLTEARRDGELYGEDRLFAFLTSLRTRSTTKIVDSVLADVLEFARNDLRDDLAILVAKRLPEARWD